MNFTEGEIAYLNEMHALTTTADGALIFVGLSPDESGEYLKLSRSRGGNSYEDGERYLALHEKHEITRIRILAAESISRNSDNDVH